MRNRKNLKGSNLYVNDDVSERVMAKRREQMANLKQARIDGKIAYFILDKLIIKDREVKDQAVAVTGEQTFKKDLRSKSKSRSTR